MFLWPENWDTWRVWLGCQTQWIHSYQGMEGKHRYEGLNYAGVDVVIRRYGYRGEKAGEIFEGLQWMEAAALPLMNKR